MANGLRAAVAAIGLPPGEEREAAFAAVAQDYLASERPPPSAATGGFLAMKAWRFAAFCGLLVGWGALAAVTLQRGRGAELPRPALAAPIVTYDFSTVPWFCRDAACVFEALRREWDGFDAEQRRCWQPLALQALEALDYGRLTPAQRAFAVRIGAAL